MSQPYVGEIRMFGGTFGPAGWMTCDGQLLPISEFETLFNLIGTTYGGDGEETFGLPALNGRFPAHMGTSGGPTYQLAQQFGSADFTVLSQHMPTHAHAMLASTDPASSPNPGGNVLATLPAAGTQSAYGTKAPAGAINGASVVPAGGSQPHDNLQPFLAVTFIISLFGVFPTT